ncbi:Zn-dependent exopeptidase [Pholiota conissans]|uniref:Zn-dependent exopeptidase n=1 Tax=Pholiota conissans TaxID=109636 RepID=A0A9P5ZB08_9AGAR|nr:Zn-dependent exopeptidase [Pholiota conissans]
MGEKLVDQASLSPQTSQDRNRVPIGRALVVSLFFVALSIVVSVLLIIAPALLWSVWYDDNTLSKIKTFIRDSPSNELDRLGYGPRHVFGTAKHTKLSIPNPASAIKASRIYATKPHMAGTVGDLATAKEFLELLRRELGIIHSPPTNKLVFKAGSDESQRATRSVSKASAPYVWIDTYYPVMNTPEDRLLEIVDDSGKTLLGTSLVEFSDHTDPDASKYNDAVPTFHGLSRGGDVAGPLVDGNYCTYEDYQRLLMRKGNITGFIVMCRYGGIFRGLKVKGGEELGAVGVLIYSDPRDDGTVTNYNGYPSYPYGPARNPTSVQRGSVQYLSIYAGDPTTPGYPSYENSTRTEGSNIPKIPSLPISWTNANLMFRTLTKGDAFEGKHVRLVNNVNTRIIPIWNTLGVIPGIIKNEVVVVGNHRDGRVMGAADPSSGTASVHEIVRGLGHLLRRGWKPLRTILIASWDAEEYGLIGSTEWGEDFKDWIDAHVVAYLNLDSSVSGSRLHASGSPLLAHFIREKAEQLPHPTDTGRTLWDARSDTGKYTGPSISAEVFAIHNMQYSTVDDVGVAPLGSGSDYTVFLQRSGIPSSNGGFSATLFDPVYHYHSIFDTQRWQELYADPGFFRHVAVAKHLGLQILGVSSSPVLPFNATHYAFEVESYLRTVEQLASEFSIDIDFNALGKSINALQIASVALDEEKTKAQRDLRKLAKKWKKKHSKLQRFKRRLRRALCHIKNGLGRKCDCSHKDPGSVDSVAAWEVDDATAIGMLMHEIGDGELNVQSFEQHPKFPIDKLKKIVKRIQVANHKAGAIERGFISEEGIKDREWYRHLAVAPGKWLGYGATTFPGLSEAITFEKNVTIAQFEAGRLEKIIDRIVETIQL